MRTVFPCSLHTCWSRSHSGRTNSPRFGGHIMPSAGVATSLTPLGRLHQFVRVDTEGASSIWGTVGGQMVPNQDCRFDGDGSTSSSRSRVHCGVIVQQQHCLWQQSRSVAPNTLRTSGNCALIPTGRKHKFTTMQCDAISTRSSK
jgi:hypothetical protein